jgi:hypothetical protein
VRLAALVAVAFALSACQATLQVGIDAHGDGSGLVTVTATLDRDAARTVPDLAQELRTSDLQKAGWTIVGPRPAANGGVQVAASKPFHNRAEAIQVLGQLSGGAPGNGPGPFNSFRIDQGHGLLTTSTTFHGVVDLTCGLRCFGDAQLQQQLGGANLGLDPAKLQQQAGVILDRIFRFEVAVRLPGSLRSSNAPTQAGNGAQWQPKLGDKVELTATSRSWNSGRVVTLGLAVLAALAVVALVLRRAVVRHRRPRSLTFHRR